MPHNQPTPKQMQAIKARILTDWLRHRIAQESGDERPNADAQTEQPKGAICAQWKRCGRPNCRCASGQLHGPYYYRFYREGGRLRKEYLSAKCPRNQRLIQHALAEREARNEYRSYTQQNARYKAEKREARLLIQEMGGTARFGERTLAQAKEQLRRKRQQRSKRRAYRSPQ